MYLVVTFYDNDFGTPMLATLQRLWRYIHDNNAHLTDRCGRTIPQIYQELLRCGALKSMVLRLFVLERLCFDVEHKTRGLSWKDVHWDRKVVDNPSHLEPDTCLHCDVDLYRCFTAVPNTEWANGECAYLNLETGDVGTF